VFDMDQSLPQLQFSFESIDAANKSSELMMIYSFILGLEFLLQQIYLLGMQYIVYRDQFD